MGFQLVCVHQIHRLFQTNLLSCISQPVSSVSHSHSAMLESSRENWLRAESSHEKWLRTESSRENWLRTESSHDKWLRTESAHEKWLRTESSCENWLRTKLLSKKIAEWERVEGVGLGKHAVGPPIGRFSPGCYSSFWDWTVTCWRHCWLAWCSQKLYEFQLLGYILWAHANQTQTLSLGNS